MTLRDEANYPRTATPYSFRHRYAKQSHAARLAVAEIAEAMGHTIEVHLKSYADLNLIPLHYYAAVNA